MSVSTIVIAFSILGIFFLAFVNLNSLLSTWDKQVQLIVYLDDGISRSNLSRLEETYKTNKEIDSFLFVSRDEAWKDFKNTFSKKSNFVTALDFNPLPSSYTIKFLESRNRLDNIRKLSEDLKGMEGVESLEYGEKWISRFENFIIFLKVFILGIGLMLCIGLILIISNTIKLSIYSRKDEIELMSILGATHRFIKFPLLLEGVFQGTIGVLIALGIVKAVHIFIKFRIQGSLEFIFRGIEIQFISNQLLWVMIIASMFIGWIGGLLSINQHLNSRNNK